MPTSNRRFERKLARQRTALAKSGMEAGNHRWLVKSVRRALWPFVRSFFYVQQRQLATQEAEIRRLSKAVQASEAHAEAGLEAVLQQFAAVRTDVEALKNRHNLHTADLQAFSATLQALSAAQHDNHLEAKGRASELHADTARLVARIDHQDALRSLAVTNTDFGIMLVSPGEIISDAVLLSGSWDSHIVELAAEVARGGKGSAVDVGAHFGTLTLPFGQLFETVHSFEPNDFNYRIFRTNLMLNDATNVRAHNSGLYSAETTLALAPQDMQEIELPTDESGHLDGHHSENLGALVFAERTAGEFVHEARTLDSYQLPDVRFIKIDVQGADGEVLMGSWNTIERCRPTVVFEWEEHLSANFSVSLEAVAAEFGKRGYSLDVLKQHNEKQIDYVARPQAGEASEPARPVA